MLTTMLGRTYENQICSIARTLEIVGERWSILILRNAMFAGMTRFSDFQRSLDISPNILTRRLETFIEYGLMTTSKVTSEHLEYHLTTKGIELKTALLALREWGDRWEAPFGAPAAIEHAACGGRVFVQAFCKKCDESPPLEQLVAKATKAYSAYLKRSE